jgi:3-phosphoshikimate 1-carboxyvinyltransferase
VIATVRTAHRLQGTVQVPGDKSISHRALMLGSIASGESRLRGLSTGADVKSTMGCMRALGVEIDESRIQGSGMRGLRAATAPLDCGNSGTTMRLLAGLLAGQDFVSELTGDESLSTRPMDRVVGPLREMGAAADWPPLRVGGNVPLHGIMYQAPFPSAQVKSALLLAGLYAEGVTAVAERVRTRDHTERLLVAMAAAVTETSESVEVRRTERLEPLDMTVPGDFSSAAFWLVAGGLIAGSAVRLRGVGVNPTRTVFADVLASAGIHVERAMERVETGEPVADLIVRPARELHPFSVDANLAPRMIDELPVLAVAATQAFGMSVIGGAAELRVKESDRLAAMEKGLRVMGADITASEDGWVINGPRHLEGGRVDSAGDHRVAMALAVAGLVADGKTEIDGAECVDISYPGFFDDLESLA